MTGNPIVDAVVGTATNLFGKVADKFFPDAKDKEAFTLAMAKEAQAMDMAELNRSMDAIIAEAQSTDKWTSRARPSFMYVIYIMILFAIPYGIWYAVHPESAVHAAEGCKAWLGAIPDGLWATFGLGYGGYSMGRSYEKGMAIKHGK